MREAAAAAARPRAGGADVARTAALPRLAVRVIVTALAIAAVPVYTRVSWSRFLNSDDANTVLQGLDIVHGNLLLHGWTLSGSPFYLIEMPVFALVGAVRGVSPAVVHEAAAIVYVAFLVIAGALAATGLTGRARWVAAGVACCLLGAPAGYVTRFLLLGPYHLGTAAAILGAVLAIGRLHGWRRDLAVLVILTAASVSDPLTVWVGTTGIAGTLVLRAVRHRDREEALLLIPVIVSAFLAQAVLIGVREVGGFTTLPLSAGLATPADALRNLQYVLVHGTLLLYGAESSAIATPIPPLWLQFHLALVLAALAAIVWAVVRAVRHADLTLQIALVVGTLDVAATVVSAQTADIGGLRYLLPAYGLLAVVAGRGAGCLLVRAPLAAVAGVAVALQAVFLLGFAARQPAAPSPRAAIESYLANHHLSHGFGQYWDASSITLETHGQVTVRAVGAAGGRVSPLLWEANAAWYRPGAGDAATFVLEPLDGTGPSEPDVLAAFGPPARQLIAAGYRIDVWDRDLDVLLTR